MLGGDDQLEAARRQGFLTAVAAVYADARLYATKQDADKNLALGLLLEAQSLQKRMGAILGGLNE